LPRDRDFERAEERDLPRDDVDLARPFAAALRERPALDRARALLRAFVLAARELFERRDLVEGLAERRFLAGLAVRTTRVPAFLAPGIIGFPVATAFPASAPTAPPTAAPTGPAMLPINAPAAAPAAGLEIGGT
jgi:hypothetical protein